ncbi:hypothetical protein B0I35DRAFT_472825 [Stachybotrys elegans]|uniref:Uncharacterized protein n=1 Tax=Stachybotrys elegans TaxID=80388 RepID=A0A8K0T0M2_9HYPO|nr:hypothetical protein B0I35DRAFT_472825 [Stachybotrys elegans]
MPTTSLQNLRPTPWQPADQDLPPHRPGEGLPGYNKEYVRQVGRASSAGLLTEYRLAGGALTHNSVLINMGIRHSDAVEPVATLEMPITSGEVKLLPSRPDIASGNDHPAPWWEEFLVMLPDVTMSRLPYPLQKALRTPARARVPVHGTQGADCI